MCAHSFPGAPLLLTMCRSQGARVCEWTPSPGITLPMPWLLLLLCAKVGTGFDSAARQGFAWLGRLQGQSSCTVLPKVSLENSEVST